ncbi:hypothetical protein H6784_05255 [Candidatus Nomurabacteria bacterium]|nr:hypothetical protein [Candidatus Kaiserbacteria bacterium]MCB9814787.1 hypothetical protein [Candidatus Nomurabacteria bacterium]
MNKVLIWLEAFNKRLSATLGKGASDVLKNSTVRTFAVITTLAIASAAIILEAINGTFWTISLIGLVVGGYFSFKFIKNKKVKPLEETEPEGENEMSNVKKFFHIINSIALKACAVLWIIAIVLAAFTMKSIAPLLLILVIGPVLFWTILFSISVIASFTGHLIISPNRFRPDDYDAKKIDGSLPSYKPDNFGIFTKIEDGRAMVKIIGQTFLTAFMQAPGLSFRGHHEPLLKRNEKYWDVIDTPPGKKDSDPLSEYRWFNWKTIFFGPYQTAWRLWEAATHKWLGLVFVGIWPIVTLRIYPMEYFEEAKTSAGEFNLKRRLDYSNHYRVFDFQVFVPMDSLDTKNMIPVKMVISEIMRVVNVYKIAFRSDNNWISRLFARIPSFVNEVTNKITVQEIIASTGETLLTEKIQPGLEALADADKGGPIYAMGLHFAPNALSIPDRSVRNKEDELRLGEVARAEIDREARMRRADGDAYAIEKSNQAIAAGDPTIGLEVARIDGQVRQAEAAGKSGGTVIVGNTAGVIANPQPRKGD